LMPISTSSGITAPGGTTASLPTKTRSPVRTGCRMRAWYRLMGAGMGRGAEISTNLAGRYDLSEIGARNFIADGRWPAAST
jgi:hypothetical protein